MSIDLHIHSTYSDGTYTPDEIVKQAKEQGLELMAITDHNNFGSLEDLRVASKKYNQSAVMGVEISTVYCDEEVHCLGYFNINEDFTAKKFDKLNSMLQGYKDSKKIQLMRMVENIGKDYPDVSYDDFIAFITSIKSNDNFNRVHVANYLMHKGMVTSVQEGFDSFLNESSKYYVKKEQINLLDAIKTIVEASGLPSVAHFVQYNFKYNDVINLVMDIINTTDVIGVEAYHSDHDEAYSSELLDFCYVYFKLINSDKNIKLFYTIGSDFHGANKKVKLGGSSKGELSQFARDVKEWCAKDTINTFKEYHLI